MKKIFRSCELLNRCTGTDAADPGFTSLDRGSRQITWKI
jgi:hypothetical protein